MGILDTAREDVVSVAPATSVEKIAQTMFDHSVGSVLVKDDGTVKGIITDRDLVEELLTGSGEANIFEDPSAASELTAQDVMNPDPVTVDHDLEFPKVLRQMEDATVRRIPITKDGDVVGIITLDDCLVRVAGESAQMSAKLDSLAGVIRGESPESNTER